MVNEEPQRMATRPPQTLLDGYRRFRRERYPLEAERLRALSRGQSPHTMVIGCADSRVDPATIFAAAPGELFVVRNVANLVPPSEGKGTYHGTSAALEFAVVELGVSNIIVLGHALCGGVAAMLSDSGSQPAGRYIAPWVSLLSRAREEVMRDAALGDGPSRQRALEHLAIRCSLENLRSFEFVSEAVANGRLTLHGAWFSIAEGELYWLDRSAGVFQRVDA